MNQEESSDCNGGSSLSDDPVANAFEGPHLVAINGAHRGSIFALGSEPMTLGRDEDSDVTIEHEGASRKHARIECRDGVYTLFDLDSKNGTWMRERLQNAPRSLRDGDRFRIGGSQFLFLDPRALITGHDVAKEAVRPRRVRHRVVRVASPIFFSLGRVDGNGLLYDISESGARIVGPSVAANPGAAVRIVLSMGPAEDGLVLQGRVSRASDSGFAVKFVGPNKRLRDILGDLSAASK